MSFVEQRLPLKGTLLILGFGCVGQGVLPLLLRHCDLSFARVVVVAASDEGREQARVSGCEFVCRHVDASNFDNVLSALLDQGDFLLNLSIGVSSTALLHWCGVRGVNYVDTCTEPWAGEHANLALTSAKHTNYALRERALALRDTCDWRSTAVIAHGANPGLSFHFLKQALLDLAKRCGLAGSAPSRRAEWAELARSLGVQVIHIAEHDSQRTNRARIEGEFANTWSVEGFMYEASQPAELGWGSHERQWPDDACGHDTGCRSAIYFHRPGGAMTIRSCTPAAGEWIGYLISSVDPVTMSDYLSVHRAGRLVYRPTVAYAYRPCAQAVESLVELGRRGWQPLAQHRLLKEELVDGTDELGVLLMGPRFGACWYGSQLDIGAARAMAPHNNATSMQVAAGVLGAFIWAICNPRAGIVEPSDLPHEVILQAALPYLGTVRSWQLEDWPGKNDSELDDGADSWQVAR